LSRSFNIYLGDKESGALPPNLLYLINTTSAVSNTVLFKQIIPLYSYIDSYRNLFVIMSSLDSDFEVEENSCFGYQIKAFK
jgi:hypothetical protein